MRPESEFPIAEGEVGLGRNGSWVGGTEGNCETVREMNHPSSRTSKGTITY